MAGCPDTQATTAYPIMAGCPDTQPTTAYPIMAGCPDTQATTAYPIMAGCPDTQPTTAYPIMAGCPDTQPTTAYPIMAGCPDTQPTTAYPIMAAVHRPFVCRRCSAAFVWASSLVIHATHVHGERLQAFLGGSHQFRQDSGNHGNVDANSRPAEFCEMAACGHVSGQAYVDCGRLPDNNHSGEDVGDLGKVRDCDLRPVKDSVDCGKLPDNNYSGEDVGDLGKVRDCDLRPVKDSVDCGKLSDENHSCEDVGNLGKVTDCDLRPVKDSVDTYGKLTVDSHPGEDSGDNGNEMVSGHPDIYSGHYSYSTEKILSDKDTGDHGVFTINTLPDKDTGDHSNFSINTLPDKDTGDHSNFTINTLPDKDAGEHSNFTINTLPDKDTVGNQGSLTDIRKLDLDAAEVPKLDKIETVTMDTDKGTAVNDAHEKMVTDAAHVRVCTQFESDQQQKQRSLTCRYCGKRCASLSKLTVHVRSHTGEKPYACRVCSKRFTTGSLLKSHERVHNKHGPYTCEICSKTFIRLCNFRNHQRRHHGTTEIYACGVCGQRFTHKENWMLHAQAHYGMGGQPRFAYGVCEEGSAYRHNVQQNDKTHTRMWQTQETSQACSNITDELFPQFDILRQNENTRTALAAAKPFVCPVCAAGFAQFTDLKEHEESHLSFTRGGPSICQSAAYLAPARPQVTVFLLPVQVYMNTPTQVSCRNSFVHIV